MAELNEGQHQRVKDIEMSAIDELLKQINIELVEARNQNLVIKIKSYGGMISDLNTIKESIKADRLMHGNPALKDAFNGVLKKIEINPRFGRERTPSAFKMEQEVSKVVPQKPQGKKPAGKKPAEKKPPIWKRIFRR